MFHEGSASKKTRPRRGETPSNTTRERMAQKLRETLIQNITRLSKRFPRIRELMKSSQQEDIMLLRVSRHHSGKIGCCDKQATNCARLGRVSKTARVTVKDNKT